MRIERVEPNGIWNIESNFHKRAFLKRDE